MILGIYIALTAIAAFYVYHLYWKGRGLPAGPRPWPLIGSSIRGPNDEFDIRECMANMVAEYGRIFTFWFGTRDVIMLSDYETCKELFLRQGDHFTDRTDVDLEHGNMIYDAGSGGGKGIRNSTGEHWREQRRFLLHVFRDFGVGRPLMEHWIIDESLYLNQAIKKQIDSENGICDPYVCILRTIGNLINTLTFGRRFEDSENTAENLKSVADAFSEAMTNPLFVGVYLPWTRNISIFKHVWRTFDNYVDGFFTFVKEQLTEHKARFDPDAEPDDFAMAYLKELHDRKKTGNMGTFSDAELIAVLFDVWTGAFESTTATIYWSILHFIHFPEYQQKVFEEIDAVVGRERKVGLEDKNNLPFTNAYIQEVQRVGNVLPVNMTRRVKKDITIMGHKIKAGSRIIPNYCGLMTDEGYFPNRKHFNPFRFLDEDGKLKKMDHFQPFGIGKRSCLGEALAKMELYILITNLAQTFEFSKVPGEPFPEMTPVHRSDFNAKRFKCAIKVRPK